MGGCLEQEINDSSFHLPPYIRLKFSVISHNVKQVCKRPLSHFARMFKLLKIFFPNFGGCFFLLHSAAKLWGKKNHPPLPVVAILIMPNVIVNKTSVSTLLQNLKWNLNFAAVLGISKTLETC